jgi:hypothetical protein
MEPDEITDFLKNFTGSSQNESAKLCTSSEQKAVGVLVIEQINGLLNQDALTKPQIDLLSILLNTWTTLKLQGKTL